MAGTPHRLAIKRAYDEPARGDGVRVLVDRLWPRGMSKERARVDQWRKELAPSTELREFYGHRPERFREFTTRYRDELRREAAAAAIAELVELLQRRPVTLLTASRDLEHSDAAVLARLIRERAARRAATNASSR